MPRLATIMMRAAAAAVAGCGEKSDCVGSSGEPSPKVLAVSPAPGQEFAADDQVYAAEFSHPMDRSSVEGACRVMGAHGAMGGTDHWRDDLRAVTFTPPSPRPRASRSRSGGAAAGAPDRGPP